MGKFLFFFSLGIIFYSYIGYGILIYFLIRLKRLFAAPLEKSAPPFSFLPDVTLVVTAYNETDFIEQKIQNSLALDYPAGKLRWIFITDGSTDGTPDRIRRFGQISVLHQAERRGKVAAMNRAIKAVQTPYVIFSDANTLLNPSAVREIVKHYADPAVGGVSGEKKIASTEKAMAAGAGEGMYWKYESLLKKLDSEFYTVVGAAGELFSVKTSLFQETEEYTIIEDFVQSLRICMAGYVIRYEPRAYATETASLSMREEQKRKIRISAGAFQAMKMLKALFNPFRYPVLSFQFLSHRILRWTLCPICLLLLLAANVYLYDVRAGEFYDVVLLLQIVFYAMAFTGWIFAGRNIKVKALYIPYYFLFMNLSVFMGFNRFIRKQQSALWEKSDRQKPIKDLNPS